MGLTLNLHNDHQQMAMLVHTSGGAFLFNKLNINFQVREQLK